MALHRSPINHHAARGTRSDAAARPTPRLQYIRLALSIDVAACAGGCSMWWAYRCGWQTARRTLTRPGRPEILPVSALGASSGTRVADRRVALSAALDLRCVSNSLPKAGSLCCISSTSLICNAPRDIVAHMSFHSLYLGTMARPSAATSTRTAPRRISVQTPPPDDASPCRAWPLAVARRCGAHPHARGVRQPVVSVPYPAPVFERRALMLAGSMPPKSFRHSRTARGSQLSVPSPMSHNRQADCREVAVPLPSIHYAPGHLDVSGPNRGTLVVRTGLGIRWVSLTYEGYIPVTPRATNPESGPGIHSRASRRPRHHLCLKPWSRRGSISRCRTAGGSGELA